MPNTPTRLFRGPLSALANVPVPALRNSVVQAGTAQTIATQTITLPAYLVGDIVVIWVQAFTGAATPTVTGPVTGWTVVEAFAGQQQYVAYKLMTDTTQTTFGLSFPNATTKTTYFVGAYTNVDTIQTLLSTQILANAAAFPATTLKSVPQLAIITQGENDGAIANTYSVGTPASTVIYRIQNTVATSAPSSAYSEQNLIAGAAAVSLGINTTGFTQSASAVIVLSNNGNSSLSAPAGSTLYTATSKTIITSISVGGGTANSNAANQTGQLRMQFAGTDFIRDVQVGAGNTSLFTPNHVIEAGETIVAFTDVGTVNAIISGVVIT